MKTSAIQWTKITTLVMLVAFILTSASCQDKKSAAQTNPTKSGVKPPTVDIHTAIVSGNLEAVRQHIAAGSDINIRDPFGGSSPLISATVFGKDEIAKVLIDAGANLNIQNNDGSTALHTAAFFCRPAMVKLLLQKGGDKTIKNKFNATAYESVLAPFSEVKPVYEMMGNALGPMGLKLDFTYIEKTRPEIAALLK